LTRRTNKRKGRLQLDDQALSKHLTAVYYLSKQSADIIKVVVSDDKYSIMDGIRQKNKFKDSTTISLVEI
jgi:hypothetical protein